jgi:hypothetical protein
MDCPILVIRLDDRRLVSLYRSVEGTIEEVGKGAAGAASWS